MKTSIVGKILMALIFASMISGLSAGPAFGKNDNKGHGPQQRDWHDNRNWHDNRDWHNNRGRDRYRPYRYQPAPVYAPPPVIYAPLPSPGIGFFFPPIFIR